MNGQIFWGVGLEFYGRSILTFKFFSDINVRYGDCLTKEGTNLGKGFCKMV